MPDMFGEEAPAENALADRLLLGPDDERGICYEFLTEASQRIGEDDMIREALVGAMEDVSRRLSTVSMNGDYKPHMLILRVFVRFPPLVAALAQSETFLPANIEAQHIETHSFLGPFFRRSAAALLVCSRPARKESVVETSEGNPLWTASNQDNWPYRRRIVRLRHSLCTTRVRR